MGGCLSGKKINIVKKPNNVDLNLYHPNNNECLNYYGLPKEIIFCRKCSYSNQKPNSEKEYSHNIKSLKPLLSIFFPNQ